MGIIKIVPLCLLFFFFPFFLCLSPAKTWPQAVGGMRWEAILTTWVHFFFLQQKSRETKQELMHEQIKGNLQYSRHCMAYRATESWADYGKFGLCLLTKEMQVLQAEVRARSRLGSWGRGVCSRARNSSLMLFMVMNSRGLARRKRRLGGGVRMERKCFPQKKKKW